MVPTRAQQGTSIFVSQNKSGEKKVSKEIGKKMQNSNEEIYFPAQILPSILCPQESATARTVAPSHAC